MTVAEFNELPSADAAPLLRACCGAARWVQALLAGRPYGSLEELLSASDAAWRSTGPADWEEAFAHHPRIGEERAAVPVEQTARDWSRGEQGGLADAESSLRAELSLGNKEYERRFGHIYLVSASGKSAAELLENLQSRLANAPEEELRIAAEEQRKIAAMRLRKLFSDTGAPTP